MTQPPPEDDLKDMFVVLEPPPGGLRRFRERRDVRRQRPLPWLVAGTALAGAAALLLLWRPVGEPEQAPLAEITPHAAAPDLLAGRDPATIHPAWIALGRVAPPAEPLQLAPDLRGALASRRVPVAESNVILYMLDARE